MVQPVNTIFFFFFNGRSRFLELNLALLLGHETYGLRDHLSLSVMGRITEYIYKKISILYAGSFAMYPYTHY